MKILLIGPTALDYYGNPIKQRKLHLPGLTLPMLAAVTPDDINLRLLSETVEDIPFDEHWDMVGITGMGSGIVRAWQIGDEFRRRGVTVVQGGIFCCPGRNRTGNLGTCGNFTLGHRYLDGLSFQGHSIEWRLSRGLK